MTGMVSASQRRVLEFAAKGHALIRSGGFNPGACCWNGGPAGAPRCARETSYALEKRGLIQPWTKPQPHWGVYLVITDAGRSILTQGEGK